MENKDIKIVIFDGDGTSWHYNNVGKYGSSWDAVSLACGVSEEVKRMFDFYYTRPELYDEWVDAQAKLFRGKRVTDVEKRVYPVPYTRGFVDFMKYSDCKILRGLLTTGLEIPAKRVKNDLGLDFCLCTSLGRINEHFSGEVREEVPLWKKGEVLRRLLRNYSIQPSEAAYVGDSKGDIPCLELCEMGIAFNPKDGETRRAADVVIRDHRKLIRLLGI